MESDKEHDSATARALAIPEVLCLVAQFTVAPALLSLGLTCTEFRDIAFAALWANLPTPFYLLKLFSALFITPKKIWSLRRQTIIKADEIERFRRYASLVRQLSSPLSSVPDGIPNIDPNVYGRIFAACTWTPVFPLLECCHFATDSLGIDIDLKTILPFFTNYLVEFSLCIPKNAVYLKDLQALPNSIQRLHLSGFFSFVHIEPINRFQGLVDLSLLTYQKDQMERLDSFLSVLPSIPTLRQLALKIHPDSLLPPLVMKTVDFVTSIDLEGRASQITEVMGVFLGLKELRLRIVDAHRIVEHSEVIRCFEVIGDRSTATLQTIKIDAGHVSYFGDVDRSQLFPLRDVIKSLLSIKCIKQFVYTHHSIHCSGLDDSNIRAIVHAWPGLECFRLPSPTRHLIPSKLTIRSLRTLARLQHLKVVGVAVLHSEVRLPQYTPFHECESNIQSYARSIFNQFHLKFDPTPIKYTSTYCSGKQAAAARIMSKIELIELIVCHVPPSDLWALLQVSSHFHPVAVKLLWKVIPSIIPLLKLLPGSLLVKDGDYRWEPTTILRTEDFATFDRYAALVEIILTGSLAVQYNGGSDTLDDSTDVHILTQICHIRPGHLLFPNLRSLKYPACGDALRITPLLSPLLEVADVRQMSLNTGDRLLHEVLLHSPRIVHLKLRVVISSTFILPASHLQCLESLSLHFIEGDCSEKQSTASEHIFNALPYLSSLRSLTFNILDKDYFSTRDPSAYRMIRCLNIRGKSNRIAEQLAVFFDLEKIFLDFTDTSDASNEIEICCQLLQRRSGSSLHSLVIKSDIPFSISVYISPLFGISSIRNFAIHDNCPTDDSVDYIPKMAQAWPFLEQLVIRGYRRSLASPKTLSSLAVLPHLQYLHLPTGIVIPSDPFSHPLSSLADGITHQYFSSAQIRRLDNA